MDLNNDRLEQATLKVNKLRELKEAIQNRMDVNDVDDPRLAHIADMLRSIEGTANGLVQQAREASGQLIAARDALLLAASRPEQEQSGLSSVASGLGTLIGRLGDAVSFVPQSASAIASSAIPIASSAISTAAKVVDSTSRAATSTASSILQTSQNVASSLCSTAGKTAQSLVGNTSNLTSQLTSTVSNTLGGILGSGTQAAQSAIGGVLGSLSGLAGQTASTVGQMTSSVGNVAQNLLGSASGLASSLTSTASSAVGGMVNAVSGMAGSLLGGGASSIVSGLLNAGTTSASAISSGLSGLAGSIGGLFGGAADAASSAISAGGSALSSATSLVGGLADGLGGLAGSLLGSAGSVASSIADAGLSAASNLLGATAEAGSSMLGAASDVAGSLLGAAADVGSGLLGAVGDIAQGAASLGADAINGLADLAGDVLDTATDLAQDVLDSAADLAGDIIDAGADLAQGAIDAVSDLVEDLTRETEDEIEGMADEMKDCQDEIDESSENMENEYDRETWDEDWEREDPDGEGENEGDENTGNDWDDENWGEKTPPDDPDEPDSGDKPDTSDGDEGDEGDEGDKDPKDYYNPENDSWDNEYWKNDNDNDEPTPEPTPEPPPNNNPEPPPWEKSELGDEPEPESETVTELSVSPGPDDKGMKASERKDRTFGWKGVQDELDSGIAASMRDGDQQIFNPYGKSTGEWTMYSFRPVDADATWPQIAITPASFEAISSMKDMLNNIPFVVVKEYFFKNAASTIVNLVQNLMNNTSTVFENLKTSKETEGSSQGSGDAKSMGTKLLDKIKEVFHTSSLKDMVIDIPYILYAGLRAKKFGNTYIFPYIVTSSTCINKACNDSEWGESQGGGIMALLKEGMQAFSNLLGGTAAALSGSMAQSANMFPAPSWQNNNTDKCDFAFDLVLINDHIIKARNNYMCVNTIIHNNRSMQKAILAFPGALYEVWLPTGQRHLMCTGDFQLFPLGLNRKVPKGFFKGSVPGANFRIGTQVVAGLENPTEIGHLDEVEVIPDAYCLKIKFTSCLNNNMNTAVFQYYVKMTGYEFKNGLDENGNPSQDGNYIVGGGPGAEQASMASDLKKYAPIGDSQKKSVDVGSRSIKSRSRDDESSVDDVAEVMIGDDGLAEIEKFDESTYNKRLERLKPYIGDENIKSESAILAVKQSTATIRESKDFLERLYGAEDGKTWWRNDPQSQIYTTMKPDYRQELRDRYGEKMTEMRKVERKVQSVKEAEKQVSKELSEAQTLDDRIPLLQKRVENMRTLNRLQAKRSEMVDEVLQIDTDLVRAAFDEQDNTVSLTKQKITPRIFAQAWNERIMNSYERDKLQYMTSEEKTRYFQDKVRGLRKIDKHGILNHTDWFLRALVLDYVVAELERLVYWFKNCAYDDYDMVYKLTRKMRMLHLDVEAIRNSDKFDINSTNLFYISDEDAKEFTKLDGILVGNTLYELFNGQVKLMFVQTSAESTQKTTKKPVEDKELLKEIQDEQKADELRKVRDDLVVRFWGSESELTKEAYADLMRDSENKSVIVADHPDITNMKQLKDIIVQLKLKMRSGREDQLLQDLVGSLANAVNVRKEALVVSKMNQMVQVASDEIKDKDNQVNAKTMG